MEATDVTSRRLAPPLTAVLALVLAAVLAALAIDALRWERKLERADLRFSATAGMRDMWTPDTVLPAGVSRTLLGLDDDIAVREAVQRFRFSRPRSPVQQLSDVTLRSAAEAALARAIQDDPGRESAALLANLRGVLALEEARLAREQSSVLLRRAAASFREAIGLDGDYHDAKFNLELALRMLQTVGQETGGGGGERAETQASGAGAASSGRGY
jgi:hypothetical protein